MYYIFLMDWTKGSVSPSVTGSARPWFSLLCTDDFTRVFPQIPCVNRRAAVVSQLEWVPRQVGPGWATSRTRGEAGWRHHPLMKVPLFLQHACGDVTFAVLLCRLSQGAVTLEGSCLCSLNSLCVLSGSPHGFR